MDCTFGFDRESVVCQENKCQCANGFYERSENICRRILYSKCNWNIISFKNVIIPIWSLLDAGDVCTINADCQGMGPDHRCNNFKCDYGASSSKSDVKQQQRTLGVQTSIDVPPSHSSIGVNTSIDVPEDDVVREDDDVKCKNYQPVILPSV